MTEVQETQSKVTLSKDKKSILESFSKILLFVAGLTGILSAAGFYIVHSYLYKVTHVFTYKIDAIIYLAAGVNLILGVLGRIINTGLTREAIVVFCFSIVVFILLLIYVRVRPPKKYLNERNSSLLDRAILYISYGVIIIFAILASLVYGWYGYESSPRFLGGGMPSSVILIFQQSTLVPSMGLPVSVNPTYPAQSQPVELLMELSDGVLIRDAQIQIPVIIKNELLYGMIDAAPPTPAATATPQP